MLSYIALLLHHFLLSHASLAVLLYAPSHQLLYEVAPITNTMSDPEWHYLHLEMYDNQRGLVGSSFHSILTAQHA